MNDAIMVGVILTLVFGAIVFYLYNRLSMAERKMGLVEGVLTDLKIMMDAAPYASEPSPYGSGPSPYAGGPSPYASRHSSMHEFEPSPEYLSAISGPVPLKDDEVEDVAEESRTLQIDELAGVPVTATNSISVTKLSPDLETMTIKELTGLAKERGLTVSSGMRRKALIEMLKESPANDIQGTLLPSVEASETIEVSA
jgi:hypothetical protein